MSWLHTLFGRGRRAAERETLRRLGVLKSEIDAARQARDRGALEGLRWRPAALGLSADEAEIEVERLEGALEALALEEAIARGGPLPVLVTGHRALGTDTCHLAAPASRPDVPGEPGGKLFLTGHRLVFLGSPSLSIGWGHVIDVTDDDRDLVVRARPAGLHRFRCNAYADVMRAAAVARVLARPAGAGR